MKMSGAYEILSVGEDHGWPLLIKASTSGAAESSARGVRQWLCDMTIELWHKNITIRNRDFPEELQGPSQPDLPLRHRPTRSGGVRVGRCRRGRSGWGGPCGSPESLYICNIRTSWITLHHFIFRELISVILVAPYRAILRYYRCDTPYGAILFKGD